MNKINFRDLALVNLVFIILINALIVYYMTRTVLVLAYEIVDEGSQVLFLSIVATILLITGVFFTIMSYLKKEPKDIRYKLCLWGYPTFILMSVISIFLA
jgi:uncharacterized BrkB/YihY/UPF0761 family membrane protein